MEILEIWGALLSWFWGGSMSEELDRIMAKFTNKSLISGCWLFLCLDISFISFPSRWFVTLCFKVIVVSETHGSSLTRLVFLKLGFRPISTESSKWYPAFPSHDAFQVPCPSQRYQWHFWSGNSPGYQRHAFGSSFFCHAIFEAGQF